MKKIQRIEKKDSSKLRYFTVYSEHHIFFIDIWPGMTLQELSDEFQQIYNGCSDELVEKFEINKNFIGNW